MPAIEAHAYTFPTDTPESDGTLEWDSTTVVVVEARAGGKCGIGYTYGHGSLAGLICSKLASAVRDVDPLDPQMAWGAMSRALRNNGETGMSYMAISAVDIALWDLKARLLDVPLARLLGRWHE